MVTTNDLRSFVKTDSYINLMNFVIVGLNIVLNKNEPSSQLFNIYANNVNKANITINELEQVCADKYKIMKFIELYFSEITDDEKDEDEDNVTIEVVPFYSNFLIGYLVDYYILKNRQNDLEGYLQKRKIANYKKFANELRTIYSKIPD
ncbi:hypothetical protein [Providencia stuartii]|uniref:hypothetical protein n=1 Tax=Providencia stuartii TaxID=588 RepID=UPI00298A008C|nr:hypothetical protein [Providencia stuartii]